MYTSYSERFKGILINTGVGFVIGLIISIILTVLVGDGFDIGILVGCTIFFGVIAAMFVCAFRKTEGFVNVAISAMWRGFSNALLSAFRGGVIGIVIGIVEIIFAMIISIPIAIYMVISYVVNFLYIGVMTILEKTNKLANKEELCVKLDKAVAVLSIVVTLGLAVWTFSIFS